MSTNKERGAFIEFKFASQNDHPPRRAYWGRIGDMLIERHKKETLEAQRKEELRILEHLWVTGKLPDRVTFWDFVKPNTILRTLYIGLINPDKFKE